MTTERVLPAIALREPADAAAPLARSRPTEAAPAARVAHRQERLLSTPLRAGMLVGASAAVYAVTLAGIAALQSGTDAALAMHNEPAMDAIARLRAHDDALEARIAAIGGRSTAVGGDYAALADDLAAYEAQLDDLAALVARVQGSAAALPHRIDLPSVTIRGSVGTRQAAPRPVTNTRASGG